MEVSEDEVRMSAVSVFDIGIQGICMGLGTNTGMSMGIDWYWYGYGYGCT